MTVPHGVRQFSLDVVHRVDKIYTFRMLHVCSSAGGIKGTFSM